MQLFKRGLSTVIFKWIFATVAGALLLVFFLNLAFQQQRTSGLVEERQTILGLDHQLSALGAAGVASKLIDLQHETALRFDCDGISGNDFRRSTTKIIFAPPLLQGSTVQAWTKQWAFPFSVSTFYYLANRDVRTLLVYDASTFPFVSDLTIPRSFNVQLLDVVNFQPAQLISAAQSFDYFNILLFTQAVDAQQLLRQLPSAAVMEVNTGTHAVTLHTSKGSETTFYLGEAMLYGLLFAPENYACLQDKALDRYRDLVALYAQKTDLLFGKLGAKPHCQQLLADGKQLLDTLATLRDTALLHEHVAALEKHNNDLEKNDCPTIY